MKHFLLCLSLVALGMLIAKILWPSDDSCLQQQAGYQAVVRTQADLLQTQIDLLAKEKARAGLLQAAHTALQQEFASTLAAKVGKIDDVMAIKVDTEVASITNLAAHIAPVERAIKQEATDTHEFVPAAFRSYWGKVLQYGMTRGK